MRHRSSTVLGSLTIAVAVIAIVGLTRGVVTVLDNHYPHHGFLRLSAIEMARTLAGGLPAIPVLAVLILAVTHAWDRRTRGRFGPVASAAGIGLLVGAAVWWIVGVNRDRFGNLWRASPDGGVLPPALSDPDAWWQNLVLLGGLGMATAVALLLLRARRRAGHPLMLLGVTALAIAPLAVRALVDAPGTRPGIILISLDTLRADHLGAYGYSRPTSPGLDRLAAESVLFEWTISQAPNTAPSHMSLFTSLYPTVHGFQNWRDRLPPWRLTLTEYLRGAGYRTRGTTDGGVMRGRYGFGEGFDVYADELKGLARSSELVSGWLDGGFADRSFFLFIHTYDIHSPYDPPPPHRGLFADPGYGGDFFPGSQELRAIAHRLDADPGAGHGLSPDDVQFMIARYDEGIRAADELLSTLIEDFRSRGLLDRAWLIVTSDHGEEFTEHGSVLHRTLYHTVTRVPLIIRPPGPASTGRRVDRLVELVDLMPTILEIAGVEPEQPVEGRSLLPLVLGDAPADGWKDVAFSEHPWFGGRRAITTPEHHLITSLNGGEIELFTYGADPLERAALEGPDVADVARTLLGRVLDWSRRQAAVASGRNVSVADGGLDAEVEAELRSLGYID